MCDGGTDWTEILRQIEAERLIAGAIPVRPRPAGESPAPETAR